MAKKKLSVYQQVEDSGRIKGTALEILYYLDRMGPCNLNDLAVYLQYVAGRKGISKRLTDLKNWGLVTNNDGVWSISNHFNPDLIRAERRAKKTTAENSTPADEAVGTAKSGPIAAELIKLSDRDWETLYSSYAAIPQINTIVDFSELERSPTHTQRYEPVLSVADLEWKQQQITDFLADIDKNNDAVAKCLKDILQELQNRPWYWWSFASKEKIAKNECNITALQTAIAELSK